MLAVGRANFKSFHWIFPIIIALTPQTKEPMWMLSELPSIAIKITYLGTDH